MLQESPLQMQLQPVPYKALEQPPQMQKIEVGIYQLRKQLNLLHKMLILTQIEQLGIM